MKIVSKQIDEYKSSVCDSVIKEYIVYEMTDDNVKISAKTVVGEKDKQELVTNIIMRITLKDRDENTETPITVIDEQLTINERNIPLVLNFYIDRETLSNPSITKEFIDGVNYYINEKEYNVMAFFLPTDGVERIECINPVIASEKQIEKIDELIRDIEINFDMSNNDDIEDGTKV